MPFSIRPYYRFITNDKRDRLSSGRPGISGQFLLALPK